MKLTIEPTTQIVSMETRQGNHGISIPARVWEGFTESGTPVRCYITRLNPLLDKDDPANAAALEEFERELKEQRTPSVEFGPLPLRLVL